MRRLSFVLAFLTGLGVTTTARQSSPQPSRPPDNVYGSRTTAILVDVVVRDAKGRPVIDLQAKDFEILEDGVHQQVGSFTLVNRGRGIGVGVKFRQPGDTTIVQTPDDAASAAQPDAVPGTTAFIFDALSPDALTLTQKAALEYVPMGGQADSRIAVYATEPSLQVLQPYTRDVALIRRGIRQVMAAGTAVKELKQEQMAAINSQQDILDSQSARLTAVGSPGSGSASAIGQLSAEQQRLDGQKRILEAFDSLDRDHRGYGATSTLTTVVASMAFEPGRKTVVLFSEGLPASPAMQAQLENIIDAANRANVTVYTVDAMGLRVRSTVSETRREVDQTGKDRLRQVTSGQEMTGGPYMRMVEKTEDLLRLDPQGGLAWLADDTGGFLVRDTNDIGAAFRRIDEDSRIHYLLTYSPKNDNFDGKFRTIQVKVGRPGVDVFARKGYRAVRTPGIGTVASYEGPAVALLDSGAMPNAFPVRAGGLVFADRGGPAIVPVIVKVNTASLQFDVDRTKGTYSGQVAVVARIKDHAGNVAHKSSQQYLLSGDEKDVEAAKKGEILFYREPRLLPGLYEIESVVYDMVAQRASARISTLNVPPDNDGELQMSSVVIVSRTERVAERDQQVHAPLYYGDVLMYPNLGDPISKASDKEVSFYVSLYTAAGGQALDATLELLHNGGRVASAPLKMEAPPAGGGRVQHVGRLPLDTLPPGTYELRIVVSDGRTERSRSAFFTVTG
jgi:VWFA-related protein